MAKYRMRLSHSVVSRHVQANGRHLALPVDENQARDGDDVMRSMECTQMLSTEQKSLRELDNGPIRTQQNPRRMLTHYLQKHNHFKLLRYLLPRSVWSRGDFLSNATTVLDEDCSVSKMVDCLHQLLKEKEHSILESVDPIELVDGPTPMKSKTHYSYLVRVIFQRKTKIPWRYNWEGIRYLRGSRSECRDASDPLFMGYIVVCIMTSSFYCLHYQGSEKPFLSPLPNSWLRLRAKDGLPAKNSFIKSILNVTGIRIGTHHNNLNVLKLQGYQLDDDDEQAPLIVPDILPMEDLEDKSKTQYTSDLEKKGIHFARKHLYQELLRQSQTNKVGCRHYVKGALTNKPSGNFLVVDPVSMGDIDIKIALWTKRRYLVNATSNPKSDVSTHSGTDENTTDPKVCEGIKVGAYVIQKDDKNLVVDRTWVRIRRVRDFECSEKLLASLHKVARALPAQGGSRNHLKDVGTMFAVGKRINYRKECVDYSLGKNNSCVANENPLSCKLGRSFAEVQYSEVLNNMKFTESACGISPPLEMGGSAGITSSMAISKNLGNATHMDVNDASVGFSIWHETHPGSAENWFFILPNVVVSHEDKTYQGIMVQLSHGVSISWDGRVLRHGTAVPKNVGKLTDGKTNHVIGTYWGACAKLYEHESTCNEMRDFRSKTNASSS